MATNVLGHADRRRYNPSRDIAYCWPWLMRASLDRVSEDVGEAWAIKFIKNNSISNDELVKVAKSLATFMSLCNKPDESRDTALGTLKESGYYDCSDEARTIILAAMGETMLAAFFLAIRDVLVEDEPSPFNDKRFGELVDKSMKEICLRNESFFGRILRKIRSWF